MMNMKSLVLAVVATVACSSFAENWYVSESGNDSNDGKSWETAFRRLYKPLGRNNKDGRGLAQPGDTVWVENGYECSTEKDDTYMGAIPSTGSGSATVIVQPGVTFRSRSGDWRTGAIIRGVGAYPCLSVTEGATAFGFQLIGGGTTGANCGGVYGVNRSTSVVSNCLVTGCSSKAVNAGVGNVLNVRLCNSVVTENVNSCLNNCDVVDSVIANGTTPVFKPGNDATAYITLDHCTITNFTNAKLFQGVCRLTKCDLLHNDGQLISVSDCVLDGCKILNNRLVTATKQQSGLINGSGTVLSNCLVTANTTDFTGDTGYGFTGGCLFGSGVRAVGCVVTGNTFGGVYTKSGNAYGVIGQEADFEGCLVMGNSLPSGGRYLREGSARNSVFVHTGETLTSMCLNTKFCNSTVYGNCQSNPGVSTNSVWWNTATQACGDKSVTLTAWTDRTVPVNSCSYRAADDPTGTSFSTDPQLDLDVTSKTFMMPLKDSPCIDKCTGDFDFDWMHVVGAKDACKHKRVIGAAADIGGVEYKPTYGLQVLLR